MSKFEFGDIIRGAVIALGNDEPNEVPCVGIVIPYDHVGATEPTKALGCIWHSLNKLVTKG